MGERKYREAIAEALQDKDICAVPYLAEALQNPDKGNNALLIDILINTLAGPYYQERDTKYENDIKVPAYLGACWGMYGLHLPGAFRSWERMKNAPKKLTIGPNIYLDRPLYQYHYESLRWFDYWMKGIDNGIMEEPPVRVFVMGTGEWRSADAWPLPETKWTPFYLHFNGLLSEHEFWPGEGADIFEDNKPYHGSLRYLSPPMVENTEVIGPIALNLYASSSDTEILWFASLFDVAPNGEEKLLTRGWLRGSHRATDPRYSKPWMPYHPHTGSEPLKPGQVYEFNIEIRPTACLFALGHRIGLKIGCVDDEPVRNLMDAIGAGHIWRRTPSMVTVYHDADYPSHLLVPITRGNLIGTYMSGGVLGYPY
jgi:predicted acyl esterase